MPTQNIQIKPKLNPNTEYTKPIKHWNKNSPQNNHTECTYRVSKQYKTPTQNTDTYYQQLMKFPYRTPRKITTYSKTPTQITHTESQANPEHVQFVCIYQSFGKRYTYLSLLPKFGKHFCCNLKCKFEIQKFGILTKVCKVKAICFKWYPLTKVL